MMLQRRRTDGVRKRHICAAEQPDSRAQVAYDKKPKSGVEEKRESKDREKEYGDARLVVGTVVLAEGDVAIAVELWRALQVVRSQ